MGDAGARVERFSLRKGAHDQSSLQAGGLDQEERTETLRKENRLNSYFPWGYEGGRNKRGKCDGKNGRRSLVPAGGERVKSERRNSQSKLRSA